MSKIIKKHFKSLLSKFNDIDGDYVELGFGRGIKTSYIASLMLDGSITKRQMWLFDSFEGLPEPTKEDNSERVTEKGQLKRSINYYYNFRKKYPEIESHVSKGFFSKTVPKGYKGSGIAILFIDCDMYESYKDAFKIVDRVVDGGLILFDEYNNKYWPGATKAVDSFFGKENVKYHYSDYSEANYYVVNKKNKKNI